MKIVALIPIKLNNERYMVKIQRDLQMVFSR